MFLMLFVLPSGCRVYHPTRGEWGGEEFTPFLSLFVTKVLKGRDPPFVLSGTLPYPLLPGYAPNPPTPLLPQDLDSLLNQLFCCYFSLT